MDNYLISMECILSVKNDFPLRNNTALGMLAVHWKGCSFSLDCSYTPDALHSKAGHQKGALLGGHISPSVWSPVGRHKAIGLEQKHLWLWEKVLTASFNASLSEFYFVRPQNILKRHFGTYWKERPEYADITGGVGVLNQQNANTAPTEWGGKLERLVEMTLEKPQPWTVSSLLLGGEDSPTLLLSR